MLNFKWTSRFKKDYKKIMKSGKDISLLDNIMKKLILGQQLEKKFINHKLKGSYKGHREYHVEPDWLLVYKLNEPENVITFVRTGTHSDLFN